MIGAGLSYTLLMVLMFRLAAAYPLIVPASR